MVIDLGTAIRRNLHCVLYRPQALALSLNIDAYLNLLEKRIELS